MKKKLLFVVDERMMGGVSVVLNDLLHLLDETLFDIDVLVLHDRGDMLTELPPHVHLLFGSSYFEAIDYTLKEVVAQRDLRLLYRKLRVVLDLKTGRIKHKIGKQRKKFLQETYDVEVAFKDGFSAIFTAYGPTPKKVHWLHCSYQTFNPNEKYPALFKETLCKFQKIIGVAPNVVKEFNELYHLEQLTEAIPVAMDVDRIKQQATNPSNLILDHTKLQIIALGRAHPVKGYERMIAVLDQLHKEGLLDQAELHIFGDGPLFETMQQLIKEKQLDTIVFMEGSIENPYAELKNFDLLLLPSYSEAFGTVITEAFILGVPVLSTRTSASELSVIEDENGWICENSEAGLYTGLKDLMEHQHKLVKAKHHLEGFLYNNDIFMRKITEILYNDR